MFQNRKLIIATKHQKEKVIAPLLERELGVVCFTDETFDTDILGTFSGEVEREKDPISTAREKCIQAMQLNNCDLGVASEGSFGQHPSIFFANADEEVLIFIDKKHHLEIVVRELSTSTNFDGKAIDTKKELIEFADSVGFPEHGLILRKSKEENSNIYKGIVDMEVLTETFKQMYSKFNTAYVETDMRAMYNPTRMAVIEKTTEKLLQKIKSTCPKCKIPGFGVTSVKKGLECSLCGMPTNSTLSYIYVCQHCKFEEEKRYPHQKKIEDPTYCNFCNP